jgi:antitoxin component of RelBE/YafQ-DinJ toxin-antitoxin module
MLITMVIDDDVLAFARAAAHRDGITLGAAMSLLVRQGIAVQEQPTLRPPVAPKNRLLPMRANVHPTAMGATPETRESAKISVGHGFAG